MDNGFARGDLAYAQLGSSEAVRDINRDVVLELIRSHQPVARADLSRLSGLQPSTISSIVEQLLNEQWISEGGIARRTRGRRPTLLSLNDRLVMLAVDIRPRRAVAAVVDLNGRILARQDVLLPSDPEPAILRVIEGMEDLRKRHVSHVFEGIGISVPGRIDPATNLLVLAPNPAWVGYDIRGAVEKRLNLKVELTNDAHASLLSELWFGRMNGIRNAALVSIAEGISVAILTNGLIVSGLRGLAGEFGHIQIDRDGPACVCGQRGCWQVFASSSAALRFYAEMAPASSPLSIQGLMQLAEEEDEHAIRALAKQACYVGRGLRLITAALAPELILIAGDLAVSWHRFGPIVEGELCKTMVAGPPPALTLTTDMELSRLNGAAATALQRHSGYYSSRQTPRQASQPVSASTLS
jgi:predicted NBD/HSP70 family sugar kinase